MQKDDNDEDVHRAIMRHLALDPVACFGTTQPSHEQVKTLVRHTQLMQLVQHYACAERFGQWQSLLKQPLVRTAMFHLISHNYSVIAGYSGNAIHYAAKNDSLFQPAQLPYAVAMLRFMGCDLEHQLDSDGEYALTAINRVMGVRKWNASSNLLLRWLYNRHHNCYEPCKKTKELLQLK